MLQVAALEGGAFSAELRGYLGAREATATAFSKDSKNEPIDLGQLHAEDDLLHR